MNAIQLALPFEESKPKWHNIYCINPNGELDIANLNKRITDDSRGVKVILDVTHCDEMDREAEFRKEFLNVNTYDNPLV